jgi:hypothetical protein
MPAKNSSPINGLVQVNTGELTAKARKVLTEHVKHIKRVKANTPITLKPHPAGGAKKKKA